MKPDWVQEQYIKEMIIPKYKLDQEDFYFENGKMVFTESYHKRRGKCCNNSCKHCPWKKDLSEGDEYRERYFDED